MNKIKEMFFKAFEIESKVESIEFVIDFDGEIGQVNEQKPNFTYPEITDRILLELYCLLYKEGIYGYSDWGGCYPIGETVDEIKQSILSTCIGVKSQIYNQVQALFKGGE